MTLNPDRLFSRSIFVFILAVAAVLTSLPARAQSTFLRRTAEQELAIAVEKIEKTVEKTQVKMDTSVERAIFKIERLRYKGADQAKIDATATKLKKSLPGIARSGLAQINREVGNGMIRMRRALGYEREFQDTLFFEADKAVHELDLMVDEAEAAIDAAAAPAP